MTELHNYLRSRKGELGSIVHNPTGRYYTVMTEGELSARTRKEQEGNQRLVIRCTIAELRNILKPDQTEMQLGDKHVAKPKTVQARQLDGTGDTE